MKSILQIADFVLENVVDNKDIEGLSKLNLNNENEKNISNFNQQTYDLKQVKKDFLNGKLKNQVSSVSLER